jgi:O-succinylbenzoic acid--CoA ligase
MVLAGSDSTVGTSDRTAFVAVSQSSGMELSREPQASDLLAERSAVTPTQTALVRTTDGEHWTYADLDTAVDRTAGQLVALGIESEDRIALLAENRVEFLWVVFAAMRLGAVLAPLDVKRSPSELAVQLDRVAPTVVLCTAETADMAVEAATEATIASRDPIPVVSLDSAGSTTMLQEREPATVERASPDAGTVRFVLATSGSTGEPKAVRLTAGNVRASALASAMRLGVAPDDRWLSPLPAYHMGGLAPALRSTLYGTTAILQPEFEAEATLAALREYDATCLSLVPTALSRLLDVADGGLSALRFVLCGGAPTPPALVERCARRDVALCPTYGMTEATSQIATASPEEARSHEGTVGRPLLWTDVTIVSEDGEPVSTGESGELVVDGPTVTPGYDDPATTEAAVGDYGLHTGDLGYRDEAGRLWITGRLDDRIVTGGENVDPEVVRRALCAQDSIATAAVVGLDDPEWGEQVAALVVPADSEAACVDRDALQDSLRARLADYECPKTIATAASLPRTASGTVDRDEVRSRLTEADGQSTDR